MSIQPVVAIDLGGTKIQSVVVDADGHILGQDRRATLADDGIDAVVGRMVDSARSAIAQSEISASDLVAAGISAPGPCDFDRGVILQPPNLPGWNTVPLATLIEEHLGLPAILENDANAAALGELRHGAGRGSRHLIYLTVSTGIGGGLILDGRIYRGADGTAGELGHVTVEEQGPLHTCGMRGCLEIMASGTAIGRMAEEAVAAGRLTTLARAAPDGEITAVHVHEAADAGDQVAGEILDQAARYLGVGLAGFINIFNPQVIVIGGGVTRIGSRFLEPAFALARSRAFRLPAQTVRFKLAELDGRAEAIGAAELARDTIASRRS